jgi:hypothetical protein
LQLDALYAAHWLVQGNSYAHGPRLSIGSTWGNRLGDVTVWASLFRAFPFLATSTPGSLTGTSTTGTSKRASRSRYGPTRACASPWPWRRLSTDQGHSASVWGCSKLSWQGGLRGHSRTSVGVSDTISLTRWLSTFYGASIDVTPPTVVESRGEGAPSPSA